MLYFDVISPQNGQTLRDPKPPVRGRSFNKEFLNHWAIEARSVRDRKRKERYLRFIYLSFLYFGVILSLISKRE